MKACRQTRRLLELQFAGELSWKQELQLTDHLSAGPECAAEAQAQGHVLETLGGYREAPLAKIDVERFVQKVQDRIANEPVGVSQAAPMESKSGSRSMVLAAAALLLVALTWAVRDRMGARDGGSPNQEELAGVPTEVDETAFQAERHRAAVDELRHALASLEGEEPDWELYSEGAQGLRDSDWPLTGLLSGLLGDPEERVARAAVLALGREGSTLAQRRLWSLRGDERLGASAIDALGAHGALTTEQNVEMYWDGTHRAAALQIMAHWHGADALAGARLLLQAAPDRRVPADHYHTLASVLGRANLEGQELALQWLQSPRLEQDAWAMHIAMHDLSGAFDGYLASGAGSRWEAGAMALAGHYPSEQWVSFLAERCARSRTADRAVQVLAKQPGLAALELLFEQESNRMVGEEVWLEAWTQANAAGGSRMVALAHQYRLAGTRSEREHLADVLLLGSQLGTGESLVELASARDLPERLRCSMVLHAGRVGDMRAGYGLETLFESMERKDSSLAACVLIALSQLHESDYVLDFLQQQGQVGEADCRTILTLCDPKSRRSERERRYLIARKLKPVLGKRNLSSLE
ncbi:MAG: hypothetical protein P1V35_11755 [Planctomycetota bacterium]|nr:hypothetical protein [Planctomycetota bacterium]